MKFCIALMIIISLDSISSVKTAASRLTSRLKHVDVDSVLRSDRLLNVYLRCLLENVKCTRDGAELRRIMPDLLSNECEECSTEQKEGGVRLVKFIAREKPEAWKKLIDKYDPKKIYRIKWAKEIKEVGINVD